MCCPVVRVLLLCIRYVIVVAGVVVIVCVRFGFDLCVFSSF